MKLEYNRSFKKDYKKLSEKLRIQVGVRIELFKEDKFNPTLNNHAIHHPYEGCRSINVSGDIRALFEIDDDTVTFIRVGTHPELYK